MLKTGSQKVMNQPPLNVRRELSIVLITICCSAIVLPGLIFAVGSRIFGPYGSTEGIVSIYQTILHDLPEPRLAAWIIAVGPALVIVLLRLIFRLTAPGEPPAPAAAPRTRREPTLNA
jgi:hypothetical protein